MVNKIIDGKLLSVQILNEIKEEREKLNIVPGLALILAGNDPASSIYVSSKAKRCEELGYHSVIQRYDENISEEEILSKVDEFNNDASIHGILVQLPLPKQINEMKVIERINPDKDVDGFHPITFGKLVIGESTFIPCTPAGIMEMIKRYNIVTKGRHAVVLGRSNIVGKPIANLLLQKADNADSTVTICHSRTKDISSYTRTADILIAAIGKANFVKKDMIKEGCVIIDVGINRIEDTTAKKGYRVVGDVDYNDCYEKASMITPVPGGVGMMTVAMLMLNTLIAAKKAHKKVK